METTEPRFGAHFEAGQGTEFTLWAPLSRAVDVVLTSPEGTESRIALTPLENGAFRHRAPDVEPGWRYSYLVDGAGPFPDPASRFQPQDVHRPSEVVDPTYPWTDAEWRGQNYEDAVIYELHVGTFTPEGTFLAILSRLDYLRDLGVTAIELMPIADFPGRYNWGYDGTFLFAPDARYGRPEDLKLLIDTCHARGIAVLLDVVYNHFGPDGNYLWPISRPFFSHEVGTLWGAGIDIGDPVVAAYYEENARFWIAEYHFDGLRMDAVHALDSRWRRSFLLNVQQAARAAAPERHVFLVLENVDNEADLLRDSPDGAYDAQWNDNFHTALHALLTGERDGHYGDHNVPELTLERTLREGFAFQGQYSKWQQRNLGTPTAGLALTRFVYFIQTHDMCGNRAFGERLHQLVEPDAYTAAVTLYLFLPGIPMLFMGEEFLASTPFLFFCDHKEELRDSIRQGRIDQHVAYHDWRDPATKAKIPDPQAEETFQASHLDWDDASRNAETLALYRQLLALRARYLPGLRRDQASMRIIRQGRLFLIVLKDEWEHDALACVVNFEPKDCPLPTIIQANDWEAIVCTKPWQGGELAPRSAVWLVHARHKR